MYVHVVLCKSHENGGGYFRIFCVCKNGGRYGIKMCVHTYINTI